jgi:DNA replication protein DnaC
MKTLETKSVVLLHHHLKSLRLPTIGAECEKVAKQAAADNVDHLTYLLQLLELELLDREKRAAERRLKAARFPTIKTLETFDFAARPLVNKILIAELARCEYVDKRENILMIGNPGTGKSHLATALAAQACQKGYRVCFFRTTELVTTLIEARDERSFTRLKAQLAKLDLLVLDELGYVPATKVGAELLFDVISTAYERTSLIVTSNLPFESWTEVLGSERLTGATLDRLTHRCRIIETKGCSYVKQPRKGTVEFGHFGLAGPLRVGGTPRQKFAVSGHEWTRSSSFRAPCSARHSPCRDHLAIG